jgi:myo-inositol 2-dehydrogenase/D-chiro-inositol 1-dehydrogenase
MTVPVGVIGAGMIGQDHICRLTRVVTGATVTAVTDIDAGRAAEVAARVGAAALPAGAELIASAEVDAVLVTSWGPTHAEHVLNAVAAGKPVFCEKPLAWKNSCPSSNGRASPSTWKPTRTTSARRTPRPSSSSAPSTSPG